MQPQLDILTDCDGVLLDWAGGFTQWLFSRLGPPWQVSSVPPYPMHAFRPADWIRDAYGLSYADAPPLFSQFRVSPHFANLMPYRDACEWLPRIAEDYAARFVIISSAGTEPEVEAHRKTNLQACFGDVFAPFTLLPPMENKRTALSRHAPTLWLDDHLPHVLDGHAVGHIAFHFDRFGELHPDAPRRVSSWAEVHAWLSRNR